MKIFFDNCTSPVMASTLNGYVLHDGHTAHHIRELMSPNVTDIEWISALGEDKEAWIVVTGDGRIRKNKPERDAFRRAGLKGLVLAPAYQKTPMNRCCAVLVHSWDRCFTLMENFEPPFLVEMSINWSGRLKQLPLEAS